MKKSFLAIAAATVLLAGITTAGVAGGVAAVTSTPAVAYQAGAPTGLGGSTIAVTCFYTIDNGWVTVWGNATFTGPAPGFALFATPVPATRYGPSNVPVGRMWHKGVFTDLVINGGVVGTIGSITPIANTVTWTFTYYAGT